jgi:hypothetical protein
MKKLALHCCYSLTLTEFRGEIVFTNYRNLQKIAVCYIRQWDPSLLIPMEPRLENVCRLFSVCLTHRSKFQSDLSALHSVPVVVLNRFCLLALTGLGGNRKVELYSCSGIYDFSPLRNVPSVVLSSVPTLLNGIGLENVNHLTIRNCDNFSDVSALGNVKHLSLEGCCMLKKVTSLENVQTVSILYCNNLSDLDGLGNNEKVIIQRKYIDLLRASSIFSIDDYDMTSRKSEVDDVVVFLRKANRSHKVEESITV